jgi:hypothetical protein
MDATLLNLQTLLRKIGRGVILYAHDGTVLANTTLKNPIRWDPNGVALQLQHLGDTEGEIIGQPNFTVANLTLPEISGGAVYEATATGENPVVDMPLFMADPNLLHLVTPTGSPHAGLERVQDVSERTLVVMPERLFKRPNLPGYGTLQYATGGVWTLDGLPLTAAQTTLLAHSIWFWRGYFNRAPRRFRGGHGDDAKNIEVCQFTSMMHPDMPDGHHLYTQGNPFLYGIEIEPGS